MTAGKIDGAGATAQHIPVMLGEVLRTLSPAANETYVDGTFGAGGYARAVLDAAPCRLFAIDRDPDAIARAQKMEQDYGGRFTALHGCFGDIAGLLQSASIENVEGIVLDLGVSSFQLDEAERGFSFRRDGPLDMRMGQSGLSAADVVNTAAEEDIARIIFEYGEDKASRRIARAIVAARDKEKIMTTAQLARIVHSVLPMHGGMKTDTATRTFQALRIHVNDEMGEIDRALEASLSLLKPGGRLVVVSFHSLEDGRVKKFLRRHGSHQSGGGLSRHLPPVADEETPALFDVKDKGGIAASPEEAARNPRARSARLRWAVRTAAPVGKAVADA